MAGSICSGSKAERAGTSAQRVVEIKYIDGQGGIAWADRRGRPVTLRSFHLLFITAATLLAVFLAFWTIDRYLAGGALEYAVIACLSIAAAVGLVVYAAAFRRRSRYW